jgi:hypothetical protein
VNRYVAAPALPDQKEGLFRANDQAAGCGAELHVSSIGGKASRGRNDGDIQRAASDRLE